jgi:hypothetical protein
MYNKPAGCSTTAYGAPHKQTNKQIIYEAYKNEIEDIKWHKIISMGHYNTSSQAK